MLSINVFRRASEQQSNLARNIDSKNAAPDSIVARSLPVADFIDSIGQKRKSGRALRDVRSPFAYLAPQQLRQLRHVDSNAPRLIERQHLSDVSFGLRLASVDVDE